MYVYTCAFYGKKLYIFFNRYPAHPPFVRVVSPRMMQYTGHVTVGGSICIALLSLTSSLQGWSPQFSIEGVLK